LLKAEWQDQSSLSGFTGHDDIANRGRSQWRIGSVPDYRWILCPGVITVIREREHLLKRGFYISDMGVVGVAVSLPVSSLWKRHHQRIERMIDAETEC
jgi:hypothetical protein